MTNFSELTAVMLTLEPLEVMAHLPKTYSKDLFYGKTDRTKYMQGAVAEDTAHLTLKFGFPPTVPLEHKQAVLQNWSPEPVTISRVSFFPGRLPDTIYTVIIAEVEPTANLLSAYSRLSMLVNEDQFESEGYKPHITLAYIKTDDQVKVDRWISKLSAHFEGLVLNPQGVEFS